MRTTVTRKVPAPEQRPAWRPVATHALMLALAGCTVAPTDVPPGAPAIVKKVPVTSADGKWELVTSTFIGAGRIPGVARATLAFEDGRLAAFSGCNQAQGPAFHVEGRLEVTRLSATRRACSEPLATFETRYFKLLQATPVYRVEGETLTLLDGQHSARFRRAVAGGSGPTQ